MHVLVEVAVDVLVYFALVVLRTLQMLTYLEVKLLLDVGRETVVLQVLRQVSQVGVLVLLLRRRSSMQIIQIGRAHGFTFVKAARVLSMFPCAHVSQLEFLHTSFASRRLAFLPFAAGFLKAILFGFGERTTLGKEQGRILAKREALSITLE